MADPPPPRKSSLPDSRQVTIDGLAMFVHRLGSRWYAPCPFCPEPVGETFSVGGGDYYAGGDALEVYYCFGCGKRGTLESTPESRAIYAHEKMMAMPEWADVDKYSAMVGKRYRIDPARLRKVVTGKRQRGRPFDWDAWRAIGEGLTDEQRDAFLKTIDDA